MAQILHIWDLVDSGPFLVSVIQSDWLSHDGDLVQRDPAEVSLGLEDVPADVRAEIERAAAAEGVVDTWAMDADQAAGLAARLRTLPPTWAARVAEGLETAGGHTRQRRRRNAPEFIYDRRADL